MKRKIPFPESDADHMHRVAVTSMLYHQPDDSLDFDPCPEFHPDTINPHRLLRMALTHDLCEAIAGDVTPHCGADLLGTKEEMEAQAMEHIARVVGEPLGPELADLWREYEDQITPTAKIVKDIDKFEMLVQAFEYEEEHLNECSPTGNPLQDTPRGGEQHNSNENHQTSGPPPPAVCDEPLRDFFQRCQGQMKTPLFQKLDAELRERRRKMLVEKGWDITDGER